ncbi:DUF4097 family beta strand repeat-containing protein [Streptomyces sp. NPDC088725]|uniref:DUF4097 family beta strand repeat-containing protein n=1 Tax=Streptomyces sp. NPDC088725 TaxID=3365873 RepID=UPI0038294CCC
MATTRNRAHARTLLAAGGAALVVFGVAGCGAADASDAPVEKRSFAFSGKTLTIDAENSAVRLVPADVTDVEVTRQVDGWVFFGNGPDARWKMSGSTLSLRLKCGAVISSCEARHQIKVPRGVAVTLRGDNGSVTASGFSTALTLGSSNGAVTVRDSSGPLDLDSGNGNVTAEGISARSVAMKSGNGSLSLRLTAVPATVETRTDNGPIRIDLPRSARSASSRGSAGSDTSGTSDTSYAVTATSGNGKVQVDVPTDKNSAHRIAAHSDNGEIRVRTAN